MFDAYLSLHILFVLMSAFVFYCVSRNHSKFKFDLNSDWFCLKKDFEKRKIFLFPWLPWAKTWLHLRNGPSGSPFLFLPSQSGLAQYWPIDGQDPLLGTPPTPLPAACRWLPAAPTSRPCRTLGARRGCEGLHPRTRF
jgi:hypothetical protein